MSCGGGLFFVHFPPLHVHEAAYSQASSGFLESICTLLILRGHTCFPKVLKILDMHILPSNRWPQVKSSLSLQEVCSVASEILMYGSLCSGNAVDAVQQHASSACGRVQVDPKAVPPMLFPSVGVHHPIQPPFHFLRARQILRLLVEDAPATKIAIT